MSSHYIPERQRSFQASPQRLTSVKLFLGKEREFQGFKALHTQQLFLFLLTPAGLSLKDLKPILQERQFLTQFRHLRGGGKMHIPM